MIAYFLVIAVKQRQEACLCPSRTLDATESKIVPDPPYVPEVPQQLLNPECCAFANGGQLCRLEVRETESRKRAVFSREYRKARDQDTKGTDEVRQARAQEDEVGIAGANLSDFGSRKCVNYILLCDIA